MEAQVAQFSFEGYRIASASINIDPSFEKPGALNIGFNVKGLDNSKMKTFLLSIVTEINDEEGKVSCEIKLDGKFKYEGIDDPKVKKSLFETNGPAILFPYIRAYITALTSLSGIPAITLPTINFAKSISVEINTQS